MRSSPKEGAHAGGSASSSAALEHAEQATGHEEASGMDMGVEVAPIGEALVDPHEPSLSGSEPSRLARCFQRARPMLHSIVSLLSEDESLVIAADDRGFPVTQRRIMRPSDLPRALVIGRHNRCALPITGDDHVSLRHLLLTIWPSAGPLRIRGVDLGGRGGVMLADRKRVAGFSARTHLGISIGRTHLFVLPGGEPGQRLLDCDEKIAFRRLTGVDADGAGAQPHATAEPGAAELGGYRAMEPITPPAPRGILRLRSTRDGREVESRDLEITEDQIRRGLLIGRYSDRCSLAGDGRNLSRVHALVSEESPQSLLVYDLASTNGVRPMGQTRGPSYPVVRMTPSRGCMLGHFELSWKPSRDPLVH